jgi:hypothetical protein
MIITRYDPSRAYSPSVCSQLARAVAPPRKMRNASILGQTLADQDKMVPKEYGAGAVKITPSFSRPSGRDVSWRRRTTCSQTYNARRCSQRDCWGSESRHFLSSAYPSPNPRGESVASPHDQRSNQGMRESRDRRRIDRRYLHLKCLLGVARRSSRRAW